MIQVTKEEWDKIPADYKGRWEPWLVKGGWQADLPLNYLGKRTVLEGCIAKGHGSALLTEGVHFEIV
jgi:hypothetical protein